MWATTGTGLTVRAADDPHSGSRSAHFYSGAASTFTLRQTVTGLAAGEYLASGFLQGDGEGTTGTVQLTVATSGGATASVPFGLNGWQAWSNPTTDAVQVAAGETVTVTVSANLPAGAWGTVDDLTLVRQAQPGADTTALADAVHRAESIIRSVYTAESLARLDTALEIGHVVLGALAPTAAKVDAALVRIEEALAGLEVDGELPDPTVAPVELTVVDGDPIALPATVTVTAYDGSTTQQTVAWKPLPVILGPGVFTVDGVTEGGLAVTATITVVEKQWLRNGGFEDADVSMWTITGSGLTIGASSDAASGSRAASFWSDADYTAALTQKVTGLPSGRYTVAATTQGGDAASGDTLAVRATSKTATASAPLELAGWREFRTATTAPIAVGPDGVLTVQVALDLTAGAWGTIDSLKLVRVDEGARTAPAVGVLSHDNGWDTGLKDGDYTVRMNLWWGENASAFRLFENGVMIATVPLGYGGVSGQSASVPVTGRTNGSYVYTGELINSRGTTATGSVTVAVTDANPGKPVLSHDNWDRDGAFTVTANLWWGTNATGYRFFADDVLVAEGALAAATPKAQSAKLTVTGAPVGEHVYRVEFVNAAGTTSSAPITVSVRR